MSLPPKFLQSVFLEGVVKSRQMSLELASEICIIGVSLEFCELRRQRLGISLALVKHLMGLLNQCCDFSGLCFQHSLQALENV